ncbi:hypothetical protein Tco_1119256 [Tanacetum coccineum]
MNTCRYKKSEKSKVHIAQQTLQHLPFSPATNPGYPGRLVRRIVSRATLSPRDMVERKSTNVYVPGDLPGRHRGAHTVSVKQIIATVEGFPGRHVARDNDVVK